MSSVTRCGLANYQQTLRGTLEKSYAERVAGESLPARVGALQERRLQIVNGCRAKTKCCPSTKQMTPFWWMRINQSPRYNSYVFFDLFTAFSVCTPVALTPSVFDLIGSPGAAKVSRSSLLAFFESSSPIAVIVLATHF
jgi:hypothetical protein